MANINIKELFGSDNISVLTEKINYNFDQLILAGGGPEGPIGPSGSQGVAGPEGLRGSQWFGASGATGTINVPTDGVFRENDFKLNANGDIEYYHLTWLSAGINIKGPTGPTGPEGDGAVGLLSGKSQVNSDFGVNQFTPDFTELTTYLGKNFINDDDDYDKGSVGYTNSGIDYIVLGRGNNSLVLGRYASLFKNAATGSGATYSPPGTNKTANNFPASESDVPMFIVAQNDYKDPSLASPSFTNGISIGLMKTHTTAQYNANGADYSTKDLDFNDFANLSIENRFFDFKIKSKSMITLINDSGNSSFRLGTRGARSINSNVHSISTRLNSPIYTEFNINDSLLIDLSSGVSPQNLGIILRDDYLYNENKKKYSSTNDIRKNVSKTFITSNNYVFGDATEIVLINTSVLGTVASGTTGELGKVNNNYSDSDNFNSNFDRLPYRLGQMVINARKNTGITISGDSNINIQYQGFGYDQGFISYSGIDAAATIGSGSINSTNSPLEGVLPNDSTLEKGLSPINEPSTYDIRQPLTNQLGSKSMSRLGLYPGVLRQEKNGSGNYDTSGDPNSENRKNKFFDIAHKMLPTGSLDLYGTVRLRQQGLTDDGKQDGWVAINKKNGIVTFEEPNLINAVPTFALMSFPELASNKFSFFVVSNKALGYTAGNIPATSYVFGGTGRSAAFIGKGSAELKDYYICNGAVLADERDIISTGPFSKMAGMNIKTTTLLIENGNIGTGSTILYSENDKFEGINGETQNSFKVNNSSGVITTKNLGTYASEYANSKDILYPNWGYSVLAPKNSESGFRIVLPNYFGRVAKMVFPDSDTIVRAVSGNSLSNTILGQDSDSGFRYYSTNKKYNGSWMMKGAFESMGFPYLDGTQIPNIKSDPSGSGGHVHPIKGFTINHGSGGGVVEALRYAGNQTATNIAYTGNPAGANSGDHTHNINWFTRNNITRNTTDWYGDSNLGHYLLNSNWIKNNSVQGQGFITPSFKGTYLAINLKGVRNPSRNNTLIKNFHYIAGVPIMGVDTNDMSWFSYLGSPRDIDSETRWTMTGDVYNNNYTILASWRGSYKLNAYEFGFKSINRNDDTMHPYTYVKYLTPGTNHLSDAPLDYNSSSYPLTDWRKYSFDVYKTSILKDNNLMT